MQLLPRSLFISRPAWKNLFSLLLLGLLAGFINGLIGTGGGVLLVFALTAWSRRTGNGGFLPEERDAYANALAVMAPVSLFSAWRYARAGVLNLSAFAPLLLPTVAGGLLGGWLLDKLQLGWIRKMFALLLLVSGLLMIIRRDV